MNGDWGGVNGFGLLLLLDAMQGVNGEMIQERNE